MGATTLAPGESTDLSVAMVMHKGMGGMHVFEVTVPSNDPGNAPRVSIKGNYIER